MRRLLVIALIIITGNCFAQELNCTVQVLYSSKTQLTDPTVITAMQQTVTDFMNTRKWTNDIFQPFERIQCSMVINLTSQTSATQYAAQVTITSNRPVFNSSYNTNLLNLIDKDWSFSYASYQPLQYADNGNNGDLASLLAYYAYIIIGMDYDSYSLKGGTTFFQKAQNIVNMEQNSSITGWKSFDGTANRYWLVSQLMDDNYAPIRQAVYNYHRNGLDKMYDNPDDARSIISSSLSLLVNVNENYPNSMLMYLFFEAKQTELINIYSQATPSERTNVYNLLVKLDPTNTSKYQAILKSGQ